MEIYFKGEIGKRRWIKVKNNTITTVTVNQHIRLRSSVVLQSTLQINLTS